MHPSRSSGRFLVCNFAQECHAMSTGMAFQFSFRIKCCKTNGALVSADGRASGFGPHLVLLFADPVHAEEVLAQRRLYDVAQATLRALEAVQVTWSMLDNVVAKLCGVLSREATLCAAVLFLHFLLLFFLKHDVGRCNVRAGQKYCLYIMVVKALH